MPTLLEKIEADATRWLGQSPRRPPNQDLARYKHFLRLETHRLRMLHRAGAGGRELCQARAAMLDVLLRQILEAVRQNLPGEGKPRLPVMALVAIGGYGRGELNPQSDIDIMFLHDGDMVAGNRAHPVLAALADGLLYTLWDIGLKVGHSVRSVEDCVRVANNDMQSKTSLIEARVITGDAVLFHRFQNVVLAKCVRDFEDAYIAARVADQASRHAKFGNSATMQEPHLKNGCGGLRDYQNLLWMAYFKYRTRSLADLQQRELISDRERRQLEQAYDFLLRVRNDLHYHVNRPADVLTRGLQATLALNLGYSDRSPSRRLEKFMREVYTHMRHIYFITRNLEQRLALRPQTGRLPSLRALFRSGRQRVTQQTLDGFKFVDGEIHALTPRVFREQPRRLLRVFLYAQQRGLRLHPDLFQLIRHQLLLVDRAFYRDDHVHATFLEILNQRGNVAPLLRAMHEVGLLGKYLPCFGRLTCLVQHEFYHRYTADEHTLVCLEKLDQIWDAEKPPFNNYIEIFQRLEPPFLLYLALLLHDTGKAEPTAGKHAEASCRLAQRVAAQLHLDPPATHDLLLLIEHHLLMAQISQRRDLDDPAVIRRFAAKVETPANLDRLTLLTFADSMATSETLWNDFKESLLWTLHDRAQRLLTGAPEQVRLEEKQREALQEEVGRIMPRSFTDEELRAHFAHLPSRYYQIHPPREILADLALVHRFMHHQLAEEDRALEPVVTWHNEPDRGYTAVKICTWDRAGLFSKLTGSLTAAGVNILSAQIFSRQDGVILDTFFVNDARTGALVSSESRDRFERLIATALTGDVNLPDLIAKQKLPPSVYQSLEGEHLPTVVQFDNNTSDTRTVIDLETEDRVGLLYAVTRALSDLGLDISLAKISTEKGAAIDSFYVNELDGAKVTAPDRLQEIETALRAALSALDRG
ncbi:MAG: [protein-PII] uridylyltransferase [Verrucomicrobia bacterium]|nr:[protein-PII] uridylyltransferase [Verrucomicrobiota bacterium]